MALIITHLPRGEETPIGRPSLSHGKEPVFDLEWDKGSFGKSRFISGKRDER
jgi:hypothetical protein